MRRVVLLTVFAAGVASLSGCPSKPKDGECKTSQDCLEQQGYGKICVEGRCQECGADTDCKEGFVCRANKCEPKPQCAADADCPSGQVCENEKCVAKAPEPAPQPKAEAPAAASECSDPAAFVIHFGFNESVLTSDSQGTLQKLSDCLKTQPAKRVVVQGYCDERGTAQYNIALGSRRAESAKKYLHDLGAKGHLETVSFGKEKPVCTESTEDCWARNRRDEFKIDR
jgi:peptidoglycan-associated lipoprotein